MARPDILRRRARAALHWLAAAGLALAGAGLQAEDCFPRSSEPPPHSNNRWIHPGTNPDGMANSWPPPVATDLRGRFPCSRLFRWCDLDGVLRDAHVCALLVIQRGRLVHEYYEAANKNCGDDQDPVANGPDKLYGLASVAKSVTATLLGHVMAQPAVFGTVGLDDPVSLHLDGLPVGTALHQVTLRQALTMTSALHYDDDDNCLKKWTVDHAPEVSRTLLDAVGHYRDRDPRTTPGRDFHYAGLNTALLGLTVESLLARQPGTGPKHLDEALQAWVWQEAGMRSPARWKGDKADTPIAYCCLYMTARDLGRFGAYLLEHWKAAQTPGATRFDRWVAEAGAVQVWPDHRACYVEQRRIRIGYGHHWWSLPPSEGFSAIGIGGQFLHILPDQDTVIVQFGSWPGERAADWPDGTECDVYAAHRFLANHRWP
jgi:CubicO group peptidase (beta-lactamase class C family)